MVVGEGEGADLVEAFYKHALGVEVGESERSHDLVDAHFASIFLDFRHQGGGDFPVVDEVQPAVAELMVLPVFVRAAVVDRGDAADNLSLFVEGEEDAAVAECICRILLLVEGIDDIGNQLRNKIGILMVELVREGGKAFEILPGLDLDNLYGHGVSFGFVSDKYTDFWSIFETRSRNND